MQLVKIYFSQFMCVIVDVSNMCNIYLSTAELPIRRPKMWNKLICFTALIPWIISRVSANFNFACHTKYIDSFGKTKFLPT